MADTGVMVEQVIDDVLLAERDADTTIEGEVEDLEDRPDEVTEADACRSLDDLPSEALVPPAAVGVAEATSFVRISELDGVPLFFARGVEPRPQTFSVDTQFREVLSRTVKTVRTRAPESFGDLAKITSAGVLVNKPGMHGLGRAFDHDAWTFAKVDIRPIRQDHAAESLNRRRRYWALAALMRSHSAFVLHGEFNAAHRDHIHQDNGGSRPFTTSSEATVKLVQAICNVIFGQSPSLAVDGVFGSKSSEALRKAMTKVDLAGDVFDSGQWTRFLRRSGRLGFRLSVQS